MGSQSEPSRIARFGVFEADLIAHELRKAGLKIKLHEQPFQVLAVLLERPGNVITREELQLRVWPGGTFVDFDSGLNTAVNKLREALGDSADSPRFIETIPRRGYRFVAPVDAAGNGAAPNTAQPIEVVQEIETNAFGSAQRLKRGNWQILPWAMVAMLSVALAALAVIRFRQQPTDAHAIRFQVPPPERASFEESLSISPDGARLALLVSTAAGQRSLWTRRLDSLAAQPLPGTEGAYAPFWSPDSRFIAFFAQEKLKKIDVSGVTPLTLCDAPDGFCGTWNRKGDIVFSQFGVLYRVPAVGGQPTALTGVDQSRDLWPQFLPDGRHFLYLRLLNKRENDGIYVGSLDSKEVKRLLSSHSMPAYAKALTGPGYLLFVRDGSLMAQPFDANNLQTTSEPVAVGARVVDVDTNPFAFAFFSVSTNGVLAYQSGADTQLVWFDRAGKRLGTVEMPGYKAVPKLSADGKHVALERGDPQTGKNTIWLLELARGAASRFTFEADHSYAPVWSPDGSRIVYASLRDGIRYLYQKLSSGAQNEELLLKFGKEFSYPTDWSSDGQFIAYTIENAKTKKGLWVLPLEGDRKPFPFLQTQFNEMDGRFSPDGRWMAYTSDESGKPEVYVRKFSRGAAAGGKWQISTQGGIDPIWRRDGKELFYIGAGRKLMAVEVKAGELKGRHLFKPSVPKALFDTGMKFDAALPYTVAADGRHFLVITAAEERPRPVTVVFNWPAGMGR